jgi:hypothetical protein
LNIYSLYIYPLIASLKIFRDLFLILALTFSANSVLGQRTALPLNGHAHHSSCCPDTLPESVLSTIHRCGSTLYRELEESRFPEIRQQRIELEKQTEQWIRTKSAIIPEKTEQVFIIPVVVHVVYNHLKPEQNISDAQIYSQIESLNRDFRRLNSDTVNTPLIFRDLGADTGIEFRLAQRDPEGYPTTGITRTPTLVDGFKMDDNHVKYDNRGGKNIWSRDKYLNFWVCNIEENILGYAQYPGGFSATDGIVVNYRNFGTLGSVAFPFNQGRTVTHEVGHWLNLIHIWGDKDNCEATDFVTDTPNQETNYYQCPSFPQSSCGSFDMFMNYMDYTDDRCMNIFTHGQKNRMHATLNGFRAPIRNSDALTPPIVRDVWCDTLQRELIGQDLFLYKAENGGYATGTNAYADKAKAQYFANELNFGVITGGAIEFGRVYDAVGSAFAAIWSANNQGQPFGFPLAQKELRLQEIADDIRNNRPTVFTFDNPVNVKGSFFLGVILPESNADTLAVLASAESVTINAWELWSNDSWQNFRTSWEGSLNVNLAIFPFVCKYGIPRGRGQLPELTSGPNPVTENYINLYFRNYISESTLKIEIFDIKGRKVLEWDEIIIQPKLKLNLGTLNQNGIYFIKITNDRFTLREKFLLMKHK